MLVVANFLAGTSFAKRISNSWNVLPYDWILRIIPFKSSKKGRAYFSLGESEICPDKDDPGTSTPDKASVSLKIPSIWIHEIVFEGSTNNSKHVGCVSCEAHCFLPRTIVIIDTMSSSKKLYLKRVDPISAGSAHLCCQLEYQHQIGEKLSPSWPAES